MIPAGEKICGDYLRSHSSIVALDARVAGKTPNSQSRPWVRVTQLDAQNDADSRPEHLIGFFFQLDCFAGKDAMDDHRGQEEASLLARTVRSALHEMPEGTHDGVVVTQVRFTNMARVPEEDFEGARERYVISAVVRMHTV